MKLDGGFPWTSAPLPPRRVLPPARGEIGEVHRALLVAAWTSRDAWKTTLQEAMQNLIGSGNLVSLAKEINLSLFPEGKKISNETKIISLGTYP